MIEGMRYFLLVCLFFYGAGRQAQGRTDASEPAKEPTSFVFATAAENQTPAPETRQSSTPSTNSAAQPLPPPPDIPPENKTPPPETLPILIASPPLPEPPPLSSDVPLGGIQSASEVIKIILSLAFIFGLIYLAGTSKMQAVERRLQVTSVVAAGLPFVLLGLIAHTRDVGLLSESVLWQLRPLLALGLGWIGFTAGFRVDSKLADSIVPGTRAVSLITTSVPFATIVASCALLLLFVEHFPDNAIFLRDAIILGTAGAMTAYRPPQSLINSNPDSFRSDRVFSIITVEQLAGLIGLLVVAAYFRPQDSSVAWRLPGTAWLFITIGMGTMVGGVLWGVLSNIKAGPEFTVLILGSICFTAGLASYLRLSPLVVCFIVGLILVNLPGTAKEQIREVLEHMERPVYLLFLVVAGSLWDVTKWQGWVLLLLFIPARLFGKVLGVRLCRNQISSGLSVDEQRRLIFSPMGALSIAIIVNAQDLYFGETISWMVAAVIGGAILTEVIVQYSSRRDLINEQNAGALPSA